MATQSHIRDSLLRVREAFERRPSAALQEDSTAVAVWSGGVTTSFRAPAPPGMGTDLVTAVGGAGAAPSPGWFFRAGLASCMASSIVLEAAMRGIVLTRLEVEAHSESDARGMLGATDVPAGPLRVWLKIALEAPAASEAELRDLVATADRQSPMSGAVRRPIEIPIELQLAHSVSA